MSDWTPELRETLQNWLAERGQAVCPRCGKAITEDEVSWGTAGQTEAGTEFDFVRVECKCGEEIAYGTNWGVNDAATAVAELLDLAEDA